MPVSLALPLGPSSSPLPAHPLCPMRVMIESHCEDASDTCSSDAAWLFRAVIPATKESPDSAVPASTIGGRMARDTTIFISSAARPRDDGMANARMLRDSLRSVRRVLHLSNSRAVIVFDGLDGKPSVTPGIRSRYAIKIARVLSMLPEADAIVAEAWLHQANSLRCAMEHSRVPPTPLVFVIQDDTQVGDGAVEIAALHQRLLHDPLVEYVRFIMHLDCADAHGHVFRGYEPCTPHTKAPWLQHSDRWVDRPHFATRRHYYERLFATLPHAAKVRRRIEIAPCLRPLRACSCQWPTHACMLGPRPCDTHTVSRPIIACTPSHCSCAVNTPALSFLPAMQVTPEQVLDQRSRAARDWPLWMYGRRRAMKFDLHWPMLVDGQLVSKETAMDWLRNGRNGRAVNVTGERYVHSYLIHAYKGRSQDVGLEQISGRSYRTHNPLAWAQEDRLTKADERL